MTRVEMRANILKAMIAGGMSGGAAVALLDEYDIPLSSSPSAVRMRRLRGRQRDERHTVTQTKRHTVTSQRDISDKSNTYEERHGVTVQKNHRIKEERIEEEKEVVSKKQPPATPPAGRDSNIPLSSKGVPRKEFDVSGNFTDPQGRFKLTAAEVTDLRDRFPNYDVRGQLAKFCDVYKNISRDNAKKYIIGKIEKTWFDRQAKIKSVQKQREAEVAAEMTPEERRRASGSEAMQRERRLRSMWDSVH